MESFAARAVRAAYGAVAEEYAAAFADDLAHLPLDRSVLDAAVNRLRGRGPVLDLGCGPAQVGQYLEAGGLEVVGVDIAPKMLLVAQRRARGLSFVGGDVRALPLRSQSCAGAVAFYSLQHLPREALGAALGEIGRVLTAGGLFILATHLGEGEVYTEDFLGHRIETLGGTLYGAQELEHELRCRSFVVEQTHYRDPLPHEHQSKRIYMVTRRASSVLPRASHVVSA